MTPIQFIFIVLAAITLGAAFMVVTSRNLVHAAIWLIVTLFGVACFFVLLNAGFLAVAQVIIYIGAIAILLIFAIMLTRRVAQDSGPQINANWVLAALVAILLFGGLVWMNSLWGRVSHAFASAATWTGSTPDVGAGIGFSNCLRPALRDGFGLAAGSTDRCDRCGLGKT